MMTNWVSNSNDEPKAISKNRLKSIWLFRLQPSAIFDGIDTTERQIWLLNPYFSSTGRNFAAGMSGGIAYIFNEDGNFETKCNKDMVSLEGLDDEDQNTLKYFIEKYKKNPDQSKVIIVLKSNKIITNQLIDSIF